VCKSYKQTELYIEVPQPFLGKAVVERQAVCRESVLHPAAGKLVGMFLFGWVKIYL